MNQRVEITIGVTMAGDHDKQNGLALGLLAALCRLGPGYGADLADGEAYAVISSVSDLPMPEDLEDDR